MLDKCTYFIVRTKYELWLSQFHETSPLLPPSSRPHTSVGYCFIYHATLVRPPLPLSYPEEGLLSLFWIFRSSIVVPPHSSSFLFHIRSLQGQKSTKKTPGIRDIFCPKNHPPICNRNYVFLFSLLASGGDCKTCLPTRIISPQQILRSGHMSLKETVWVWKLASVSILES